jgi:hypothetical protein
MGLKDELLLLNAAHRTMLNEHGIFCFKKLSQLCKEAAKKGEQKITVSKEEIPAEAWRLLVEEGLTVKEFHSRDDSNVEIRWED